MIMGSPELAVKKGMAVAFSVPLAANDGKDGDDAAHELGADRPVRWTVWLEAVSTCELFW